MNEIRIYSKEPEGLLPLCYQATSCNFFKKDTEYSSYIDQTGKSTWRRTSSAGEKKRPLFRDCFKLVLIQKEFLARIQVCQSQVEPTKYEGEWTTQVFMYSDNIFKYMLLDSVYCFMYTSFNLSPQIMPLLIEDGGRLRNQARTQNADKLYKHINAYSFYSMHQINHS